MPALRIVVADDEPDIRDYFHKMLPRLGHCVVAAAENGEQLVDFCCRYRPDLAITDVKMPGMDGIEAALKIAEKVSIPVILISAYNDDERLQHADTDPIVGFLAKPIRRADLEPAIRLAMHRIKQV